MDEFRIVIYVVLGIIFVVTRIIKANKAGQSKTSKPVSRRPPAANQPRPASFEDILKEFGQKVDNQPAPTPEPIPMAKPLPKAKPLPVERVYEEGRDRRFADEESRRVFEETSKRSEGFDLKFEEDSHFANKRTKAGGGAIRKDLHEKNPLIASVKRDLKDPDSAKKAFILAEILNRKF